MNYDISPRTGIVLIIRRGGNDAEPGNGVTH